MSIVTLQLGQCGNQIGGQYFATLASNLSAPTQSHQSTVDCTSYSEEALERFFTPASQGSSGNPWHARAVMVDMESKVIAQTRQQAQRSGQWQYPERSHLCQKRGSGNNWANGFCVHGPKVKDSVLNMIQREVEKCDNFGGFLALMSLAGGTGSGLGAFITECLRDEFPHSFIVNQVVWPYTMGEVIVQNYNAVLTLSHLYQCSDAVLTLENDVLQQICSRLLAIKKVSMKDINKVIAHKLAGITQPVYRGHCSSEWRRLLRNHMGIDWQVTATPGSYGFNKSLANLLILRGKDIELADVTGFADPCLYPHWVPPGGAFETWSHPRCFNQYEKSATLLSNSQSPVEALDKVVTKAWSMFASRAFVHQYLKHGLSEEDFVDSFAALEQIIASYQKL